MKRIIICMALSVISFMIMVGSFFTHDIYKYKMWIRENRPRVEEEFTGPKMKKPTPPPMQSERRHETHLNREMHREAPSGSERK